MKKYKHIENGIITCFGESEIIHKSDMEITQEEYDILIENFKNKPEDTLELIYHMSSDGQYIGYKRTHKEVVRWYQKEVNNGMNIEEVPEEYRAEIKVKEKLSIDYQAGYDQAVLDLMGINQ